MAFAGVEGPVSGDAGDLLIEWDLVGEQAPLKIPRGNREGKSQRRNRGRAAHFDLLHADLAGQMRIMRRDGFRQRQNCIAVGLG